MKKCFLVAFICCFIHTLTAQVVVIPGYTGYAVPVENQEGDLFNFQQLKIPFDDL